MRVRVSHIVSFDIHEKCWRFFVKGNTAEDIDRRCSHAVDHLISKRLLDFFLSFLSRKPVTLEGAKGFVVQPFHRREGNLGNFIRQFSRHCQIRFQNSCNGRIAC